MPDTRTVEVETFNAGTVPFLCETPEEALSLGEKLCAWVLEPA